MGNNADERLLRTLFSCLCLPASLLGYNDQSYSKGQHKGFPGGNSPSPCSLRNNYFLQTDPSLLNFGEICKRTGEHGFGTLVDSTIFSFALQRLPWKICHPLERSPCVHCITRPCRQASSLRRLRQNQLLIFQMHRRQRDKKKVKLAPKFEPRHEYRLQIRKTVTVIFNI